MRYLPWEYACCHIAHLAHLRTTKHTSATPTTHSVRTSPSNADCTPGIHGQYVTANTHATTTLNVISRRNEASHVGNCMHTHTSTTQTYHLFGITLNASTSNSTANAAHARFHDDDHNETRTRTTWSVVQRHLLVVDSAAIAHDSQHRPLVQCEHDRPQRQRETDTVVSVSE
jgi:hypothetical protein